MQTEPEKRELKVNTNFRLRADLVAKMRQHASKWQVSQTAIMETGLAEFFAVERNALQRKD